MIKLRSIGLGVALCATFLSVAWAVVYSDTDNAFHFKGDVMVGTISDENPVQGNLIVHGRNAAGDPILQIRNGVLSKTLMVIDRDGAMTLGEGGRPSNDAVSLLHVKGPLAVWPDSPTGNWPNAKASAVFAKSPDNYFMLAVPGRTTSGLVVECEDSALDENDKYKTILGVQKGAIEFRHGVNYQGDVSATGTLRMKIDSQGRVLAGEGLTATTNVASSSQVILGKYNDTRTNDGGVDHTKGVLVVGAGTGTSARANAIRVAADGTVLVKTSGDISPGEFTSGPNP